MTRFTQGSEVGGRWNRDQRVSPSEYDTCDASPALTGRVPPRLVTEAFRIEGLVERPMTWTWDEIHALPFSIYSRDVCVAAWSKVGVNFIGLSVDRLLDVTGVVPSATHVLAISHTRHTASFPLADVSGGQAWVVWDYRNDPLQVENGRSARLFLPQPCSRMSAMWVTGFRIIAHYEA